MTAWWRPTRAEILVALAVLLATGPLVERYYAQQASRYAFSAAIWDRGTFSLEAYESVLGVDRAQVDGRTYSDKAPMQPVLGAPLYGLARALGAERAERLRVERNLGLWWQTLWFAVLPATALAVLIRREATRHVPPATATAASLIAASGTLLLPFGAMLFSHVLSAALGLVAYRLVWAEPHDRWSARALPAGLALGCAVAVEYTSVLLVAVIGTAALGRFGWAACRAIVGAAPPLLGLAAYHTIVFGGPLSTGYQHAVEYGALHEEGLVGLRAPSPERLLEVLLGSRGMFVLTPVVLAGVFGLVHVVRNPAWRGRGATALTVLGAYTLLHAGWPDATGGDSPGPRYLVPVLPFVGVGIAVALQRRPSWTLAAASISIVTMLTATLTDPLLPEERRPGEWFDALVHGRTVDSLFTMSTSTRWALVPPLVGASIAAWAAIRSDATLPRPPSPTPAPQAGSTRL